MTGFNRSTSHTVFGRALLIILLFLIVAPAMSQSWYNALKSEHKRSRFGIGVFGADPLGLGIEIFKGEFCSNGNGYKSGTIWMMNLGVENMISMPSLLDEVNYTSGEKSGTLEPGGMRAEIGVLLKLFSIAPDGFTIQMHFGPTIEGGTRKYLNTTPTTETISTADVAANAHVRLSVTSSGVEMGNSMVFITFHGGLKYQYVINAEYSYLKPTFGIIFRKVR